MPDPGPPVPAVSVEQGTGRAQEEDVLALAVVSEPEVPGPGVGKDEHQLAHQAIPKQAVRRPVPLSSTATASFTVLGLIDVSLLGVIGSYDAPPLVVRIGVAALGLITLLALQPARRGSRPALITAVAARVVSAGLAVPAFFLDAPVWVMITEGFVIVATITALILIRRTGRGLNAGHRTGSPAQA
ncbi:MAG: hypothetical protein ABJB47_03925 [Actinomycetota bacterium]